MQRCFLLALAALFFLAVLSSAQVSLPQDPDDVSNLCGIGAVVNTQGGQTVIRECLEGSGAQTAGLLPNDVILTVNGTDVTGLDLESIVSMIRGEADTTVLLRIARSGGQPFEVLITRHPVHPPTQPTP